MRPLILSLALLGAALSATAQPTRSPNFVEATALASQSDRPLAVYVHGSTWHPASKRFRDLIWSKDQFTRGLTLPLILTDLEIKQQLDKEAATKHAESHKGWNESSVRTFPAIQLYGADGHLLTTLAGAELRGLASVEALTHRLTELTKLAATRHDLLAQIGTEKDERKKLTLLSQLAALPLNAEPKLGEQFKALDPQDKTGWQARLSFNNWDFVRDITGLVNGDKYDEALAKIASQLAVPDQTPARLALIHGAKGRVLAADDRLPEAWAAFQTAHQADPEGPNGIAMHTYGMRVAGRALREALPSDSSLHDHEIGQNISRDFASVTLSSNYAPNSDDHPALFKGTTPKTGYAIHTESEKKAHAIVDLQKTCNIRALRITNRQDQAQRAATLTAWASDDQKSWQKIWTAEEVKAVWEILPTQPLKARYLKLSLNSPTPEYLNLIAVDIFGSRP